MKIGIITQPLHTNYGGLLQNYALQQVLKRLGHEPITLDQVASNRRRWKIYAGYIKTLIYYLIGKGNNRKFSYYINDKYLYYIQKNTDYFIKKYINKTPILVTTKDFRRITKDEKIEVLLVGSDQVWRPIYNDNIFDSFLDFSKGMDIKRIAYAASFGVDNWEFSRKKTDKCRDLIRLFEAISVREKSGVNLCMDYLKCKAIHVLDPTLLLDKEDYIQLVDSEKEPESKGDLFTYILDKSEEKEEIIKKVSKTLGLIPFSSMPKNPVNRRTIKNIDTCVFPSVTRWIRSFMDANFVICDSFHGAVFSIIFNKPFLVIGNEERGISRFNSLLESFGLENRMILSNSDNLSIINDSIDWSRVNDVRTLLKNRSIDFLRFYLK